MLHTYELYYSKMKSLSGHRILSIQISWLSDISLIFFYFSSIVKEVLTTYLNHSRVRFLEPTNTGVMNEESWS